MRFPFLILGATSLVLLFQNCSQIQPGVVTKAWSEADGSFDEPIVDEGDNPNVGSGGDEGGGGNGGGNGGTTGGYDSYPEGSGPTVTDEFTQAFTGSCELFKNSPVAAVIDGKDYNISSVSGGVRIAAANIVNISSISGGVLIENANRSTVQSVSGAVRIKSVQVEFVRRISGSNCIVADKVNLIQETSGSIKVIAKEIDEISRTSGTIHVYGGVVRLISHTSGGVCLHDGAKVISYSNVTGFVGVCAQ